MINCFKKGPRVLTRTWLILAKRVVVEGKVFYENALGQTATLFLAKFKDVRVQTKSLGFTLVTNNAKLTMIEWLIMLKVARTVRETAVTMMRKYNALLSKLAHSFP